MSITIPAATRQGLMLMQIRAILDYAVHSGEFVHYLPLAKSLHVFSGGKELAIVLGMIMKDDHAAGLPLSCALIRSSVTGMPGKGFFAMARQLGYTYKDEYSFWASHCVALGVQPPPPPAP